MGWQGKKDCHLGSQPVYGYWTDNKKPSVKKRFLNLSEILDLSPGVFMLSHTVPWYYITTVDQISMRTIELNTESAMA